jgi:prepilin-type N-terminal cleavage/methylation domain-containing protein
MREDNQGFTLIELLIVVVVIGVLASIAIPKFSSAREKAFVTSVVSDLRNLSSQMELYQSSNQVYPNDVALLPGFAQSQNVTVTITENNEGNGWAATAIHSGLVGGQCGIFYGTGTAANAAPATEAGVISCN